jgi:hypothetical protein
LPADSANGDFGRPPTVTTSRSLHHTARYIQRAWRVLCPPESWGTNAKPPRV